MWVGSGKMQVNTADLALAQWRSVLARKPNFARIDALAKADLMARFDSRHAQFEEWIAAVETLPVAQHYDFKSEILKIGENTSSQADIERALRILMPWRKGPFSFFGVEIDSEWRSDFKFARLQALLASANVSVAGQQILDVGCGNGYFMARLLAEEADFLVGVDPSWHYFAQFLALWRTTAMRNCHYLPTTLDALPLFDFDITLSMGVLYHRRDPLEHLRQLRESLRMGGKLVLETLVVEGDAQTVFLPSERYAGMSNVWFLPSVAALMTWLKRLGFRILAKTPAIATTSAEQRASSWLMRHSLSDFMQPDFSATIENHPPPKRVMVLAERGKV